MNKTTFFIMTLMVLAASFAFADACNGVAVFRIWNDTLLHPSRTYPEPGIDIIDDCPPDLYVTFDTIYQVHYPDTLLWPSVIDSFIDEFGGARPILPGTITGRSFYHAGWSGSHTVEIPPRYCPTCCKSGIYAKAFMFDALTERYSTWFDINTTDMLYIAYTPPYGTYLLINLHNIKKRDLSTDLGFDCHVDTLILYVWDCYDGDVLGTAGEFAVWKGTFENAVDLSVNDVYLNKYDITSEPTLEMDFSRGWNLVSVPTIEARHSSVFGMMIYGYDAYLYEYFTTDSLHPGKGYFVLSMLADTVELPRTLHSYSDTLYLGWNLIGAVNIPLPASSIETDPPGLLIPPLFGWDGADYFPADTLYPGRGYWFLSSDNGRIEVGP